MIKNKKFIVFSDDWGRHPFSCQHIMSKFLPHNKLLWVNTIGMRNPEFTVYDIKRAFGKVLSWLKPTQNNTSDMDLHSNLRIISPFMIPYNNYSFIREFNAKSVVNAVLKAAKEWDFSEPIVLSTQPLVADYIGKLKEELVVYYCVDDFVNWPGMNQPKLVQALEKSLLEKSDLVFAVSESLCKSRTNTKEETKLLTHGVDIAHFAKASQAYERPVEFKDISQPIIGFYGLIDQRFDLELVKEVLLQKPQWNIVCVGTSVIDLRELNKFDNFYHFDAVSYADLPKYAACFDVACIPYIINELTHAINPLKLREYLATGKPIVTTPMNEVFRFKEAIHIADRGENFICALEKALKTPINEEERAKSLEGESWQDKAELVSQWVEEKLQNKLHWSGNE